MVDLKPDLPLQTPSVDRKKIFKHVKRAEKASTRHAHKFLIKRLDSIRLARRNIIQWLLVVGLLIAATGLQLAWSQEGYQIVAATSGGTYAEAIAGRIDTLNPLYASSDAEIAAANLMFSGLYTYDTAGKLHKSLAQSLKIDESGKVYTITLRPDVHWHDGQLLTAKDVAFTVELIKNPAALSPLRTSWRDVSVRAVDDTTVEFRLPAQYAAFPYALTFSVLPSHILSEVPAGAVRENNFSRYPVGSGPFAFRMLQSAGIGENSHKIIQMTAHDTYFNGTAKVGRFEIHAYATREQVVKSLKSGEVNAASGVPITLMSDLEKAGYSVRSYTVNSGVYALFNVSKPILQDKAVRKALQLGADTEALRKQLPVEVPKLDLPFVRGQLTGENIPAAPVPDKMKAAELLEQAGWHLANGTRQKDDQKLSLTITTIKNDQYEKVAEGLAAQWRDLGIAVTITIIDPSAPGANFVQNTLQPRNYDVLVYELIIGTDPDVYAYWHSSQADATGYNFSNYSNSTADAALVSARSRIEPELRNAKYKTFAESWLDDAPAIGLYQPVSVYATGRHVQSLTDQTSLVSAANHYPNVLDWSVRERSVYRTP